jgi:hypothetical protein
MDLKLNLTIEPTVPRLRSEVPPTAALQIIMLGL